MSLLYSTDPEISAYIQLLKAHQTRKCALSSEIHRLNIRRTYILSNPDYRMLLELRVARRILLRKFIEIKKHLNSIRSNLSRDEASELIIYVQNLYITSLNMLQVTDPLSTRFDEEKASMNTLKVAFFQKDQKLRNLRELYHSNNKLISERTTKLIRIDNITEEVCELNERLNELTQDTMFITMEKKKKITNYSKNINVARIFFQLSEKKKDLKSKWLLRKELTDIVKRIKTDIGKYSMIIKNDKLKTYEIFSGLEQGRPLSSVASNESRRTMSQVSLEFEEFNRIIKDNAPDTSIITSKLELSINSSIPNFNEVLDISAVTSSKINLVFQSSALKNNLGRILNDIENAPLSS